MAIASIDLDLCDGCAICVDVCPMDVLRLDEATNKAVIAYGPDCDVCYLCEDECPPKAIYVDPKLSREPILPY